MKKIMLGLGLLFISVFSRAQNGLEGIVVEKYYVSNAADASGAVGFGGTLPVGSVTYRIFADMLPGYKFQAAYGVPTHTLTISTTTSFYNNTDRGAESPTYTKTQAGTHTTMIDSWFSAGAACAGNFGILKSEDNVATGGANVANANGIMANNDPTAGIPLTTQDGIYNTGATPEPVTFVGITPAQLAIFDASGTVGSLFTTNNGSWASLNGSQGPTSSNKVLIGQFTTDGYFHYELNIQIGTPTGGTQNYVVSSPAAGEITIPSLTGTFGPNILPSVNITAPVNNTHYFTGNTVNIAANASDSLGNVVSVEFFVDGVSVGVDSTAPYTASWTSTAGIHSLTARATDNDGGQTTSSPVSINVTTNAPPVVSLTSPSNGALFTAPAPVTISANASDPDGTIASVEFFVNGVSVGLDNTFPYSVVWTSVIGSANIFAIATDNTGGQTSSSHVFITIADPNALPYQLGTIVNTCVPGIFCLPLNANDSVQNVIGYDVVLNYDHTKVQPTGNITVGNALINPAWTSSAYSVDNTNGLMYISLFFNSSAPANARFNGIGEVFCVQFVKTGGFAAIDTASFSVSSLQESYFSGVAPKGVDPGKYITYRDSSFNGSLRFWVDNSAIVYDAANPGAHLVTNIHGNTAACNAPSAIAVHPDLAGNFTYNTNNGPYLNIDKDIIGTTSVQPVINGFDAFLTRKVLVNDLSFIPSVYQIIAMDANLDGVISAGDLSQINQRAVLMIPEFRQAWNYNAQGVSNGQPSKDWLFIDMTTVATNSGYNISSTFPQNDGVGYSKSHVPSVPFCLQVPVSGSGCPLIGAETYEGILMGDVNGNYSSVSNSQFRLSPNSKVVFDLSKAVQTKGYTDVPVSVVSDDAVHSLDFAFQTNESHLTYNSVADHTLYMESLSNYNQDDKTLRFTSYSLENYETGKPLASVRFALNSDKITEADFSSVEAYLNGEKATVEFRNSAAQGTVSSGDLVSIYPNPASGVVNVTVSQDATVQLLDVDGREVILQTVVNADQKQVINVKDLADGIYLMKIFNDNFVTIKKVIVNNNVK